MPGPSSASSSKPPSTGRAAGPSTQQSKTASGTKRPRLASVSEDDRPSQPSRIQKVPPGKGKAKADPNEGEEEEEDGGEADDDMEEYPPHVESSNVNTSQATGRINGRAGDSIVSLQRQLRDLKATLAETEKSRETYRTQLQKLHQLRHTDSEKNMQDMEKIWEERSKVQEEQIAELRRYAGLLSKEEDAPQKKVAALETENARLKVEVGRARQLLNEAERSKGREVQLEEEVESLKQQLRLEIEHNQASRVSNKGPLNNNSKSNIVTSKIIKLYEDMTNVTVTDYKQEKAEHGFTDNDIYSCIISLDERSLGFKLSLHFDSTSQPSSPGKSGSFEPLVSYTPTTLAHETNQDLLDALDFLTDPFDFSPSQFDTFLRTLVDRVRGS